jgi:peptidoglycan/xylan/chitin deacetylase (PgdA/CDA1 family)
MKSSLKIYYKGVILLSVLVILGVAILLPAYYQKRTQPAEVYYKAILSFSILDKSNLPNWCFDLSSMLQKYKIRASVFISGNLAEKYPKCVSLFSSNKNIDIGSQTYNYVNLTSIPDYTKQLNEIKNGKRVIDYVGKVDSKLFKAPYGLTDGNIYSLLSRSGIIADFSYSNQYNKYENGQFIKYDIITYNPSSNQSNILSVLSSSKGENVLINFDNSTPIDQIDSFLSKLKSINKNIKFASPSDVTGMNLTIRKEL